MLGGTCARLIADAAEPLVVPAPVVVELDRLASSRLGPGPFAAFLTDVGDGLLDVVDLLLEDYLRVRDLLETYADMSLGFVDAAVVAVVERLGERKLATLDRRQFTAIRPRHVTALELLPS